MCRDAIIPCLLFYIQPFTTKRDCKRKALFFNRHERQKQIQPFHYVFNTWQISIPSYCSLNKKVYYLSNKEIKKSVQFADFFKIILFIWWVGLNTFFFFGGSEKDKPEMCHLNCLDFLALEVFVLVRFDKFKTVSFFLSRSSSLRCPIVVSPLLLLWNSISPPTAEAVHIPFWVSVGTNRK